MTRPLLGVTLAGLLTAARNSREPQGFKGDEVYVRSTGVSSRRHPNGHSPEDFESAWAQAMAVRRLAK